MTPPPIFRAAIAELGRILVYEAGRDWLPTMEQQVASPVGIADATFVDPTQPVKVRLQKATRLEGLFVCQILTACALPF